MSKDSRKLHLVAFPPDSRVDLAKMFREEGFNIMLHSSLPTANEFAPSDVLILMRATIEDLTLLRAHSFEGTKILAWLFAKTSVMSEGVVTVAFSDKKSLVANVLEALQN